jgi:hypothetical protein
MIGRIMVAPHKLIGRAVIYAYKKSQPLLRQLHNSSVDNNSDKSSTNAPANDLLEVSG